MTESFDHTPVTNPTFQDGDLVMLLKWDLVGMVRSTYLYLDEECCDIELIWGSVWDEVPVSVIKVYSDTAANEGDFSSDHATRGAEDYGFMPDGALDFEFSYLEAI